MAYTSEKKLWKSEFDNNVSTEHKVQDINVNQLKIEVLDTYIKDKRITTNFEAIIDEDVTNKYFLDKKLSKINAHLSLLEKD